MPKKNRSAAVISAANAKIVHKMKTNRWHREERERSWKNPPQPRGVAGMGRVVSQSGRDRFDGVPLGVLHAGRA